MQTKQQIQQLLASAGISPRKRYGQHFLIDLNLMRLLVDAADVRKHDVVLEVGCGTGSLTEALSEKAGCVVAVELDRRLTEIAKARLADAANVQIVNADILERKSVIDKLVTGTLSGCRAKYPGRLLLVANLPYSVASCVMMNLVTGVLTADAMYVTVQKEVASRMTASPGSRDYGTLSILLASAGDVKTIRVLKPTVFWPQPQVDSAMISYTRSRTKAARIEDVELFGQVVGLLMSHRRKMLKACTKFAAGRLAGIKNWDAVFAPASVDPHNRPDRLSPDDYVALANLCGQQLSSK